MKRICPSASKHFSPSPPTRMGRPRTQTTIAPTTLWAVGRRPLQLSVSGGRTTNGPETSNLITGHNPRTSTRRPKPPKTETANPNPESRITNLGSRNQKPETRSSKPDNQNPKPEPRNRNPETRKPKPENRTPQPAT